MDDYSVNLAVHRGVVAGAVPFLVGVVLVAVLVGAVWWGRRVQARQRPPRPEEQPRLPASGPVREVSEHPEPAEVPRGDERLTPHQLGGYGSQAAARSDAHRSDPRRPATGAEDE